MAGKVKRLSKVAREFNVGITTIVDFLSKQGYDNIEASPNAKIEPEVYEVLKAEYSDDQDVKEKSVQVSHKKEKRQTVSLGDSPSKEQDSEDIDDEDNDDDEVDDAEPDVQEKEEKKDEEPTGEEPTDEEQKVNVVGKIDLESINQKTRPDKKSKKEDAEEKEEEKKQPEEEATKEEAEEEKKATEEKTSDTDQKEKEETSGDEKDKKETEKKEKPESNKLETKRDKLSGPTVVGKIELPKKKEKSEEDKKPKRKRRRIKKVDVDKQQSKEQSKKPRKKGRKKAEERPEVSEEEIQKEIKKTLERLSTGKKNKAAQLRREKRQAVSDKMKKEQEEQEEQSKVLKITEFVTVSELAAMMSVQSTEIISACMTLGIFASINQRLDAETLSIVAEEFGYQVEFVSAEVTETIQEEQDDPKDLQDRSPIVTVMGHVDHGKTSLLDQVRKENVIAGEAGGITQHIGAYSVKMDSGNKITFLDTPGHEAFTAMRARGAQVTDVAIIIIAADDNVMPQTKEAISHAQAAGVPMVFAINKVDKPGANAEKVREELANMNILLEDWGGKYQGQEISAKQGENIEALLEKVVLESDLLELKANPDKRAVGTVIESTLDKGRGYMTTVLVQGGTMRIGDIILAGPNYGRVKAMFNERGQRVEEAGPSVPVSMLGLNGPASAGDQFHIMEDEKEAKNIATKREQLQREQGIRTQKHITLDEIGRRLAIGDFQELNIVVKGDVDGSIEALSDSIIKLSTEEIQVNIIHKGVGQITDSDVLLASASNAIIIGFQVRPSASARKLAEQEEIDIRLYSIIYKATEEIKMAMEGMLSPDIQEKITGSAVIKETFKITKVGTIAGCYVNEGKINRNSKVRLIRDGIVIYTGELGSLKRFKDDVKEVQHGYECGLNVAKYNDIKEGDIVEAFEEVEVAKKLE